MDETQFEERVTWGDDSGHAATIQAQNMEVTREETIEADLDQSQSNGQQGKLKRLGLFQSELLRSDHCRQLE